MSERFFKYHGLGNDFIVLDRRAGGNAPTPEQARVWCERRRGIGADGVLVLLPSGEADARMLIVNSDGSSSEMCGNGLRCCARYLVEHGGLGRDSMVIETGRGLLACQVVRGRGGEIEEVAAEMGAPLLDARSVPVVFSGERFVREQVPLEGQFVTATAVSMGNPHLVLFDADPALAARLGPPLERHPLFPNRINVELARDEGEGFEVGVWERGAGLTEACGTGACAVAVAAIVEGRRQAGREIPVRLPGGVLHVRVSAGLGAVRQRGPAVAVFQGELI